MRIAPKQEFWIETAKYNMLELTRTTLRLSGSKETNSTIFTILGMNFAPFNPLIVASKSKRQIVLQILTQMKSNIMKSFRLEKEIRLELRNARLHNWTSRLAFLVSIHLNVQKQHLHTSYNKPSPSFSKREICMVVRCVNVVWRNKWEKTFRNRSEKWKWENWRWTQWAFLSKNLSVQKEQKIPNFSLVTNNQ